jgi:hypothetical protein
MSNIPPLPSATPKKGLSTGAKIAIGCGVLVLIVGIVIAAALAFGAFKAKQYVEGFEKEPVASAARTYAALNPDVEFVEADEESRRVTFRNEKTGELVTIDAAELESGRISFEDEKGKTTFESSGDEDGGSLTIRGPDGSATFRSGAASADDVPSWVIRYPGAAISGAYTTTSNERQSGAVTLTTEDDFERVVQYFRDELDSEGYTVETQSFSGGGQELRILQGNDADASRKLSVTISRADDNQTQAAVTYEGPEE